MEPKTKKKLVLNGCETEEFTRFDALLRDVLKIPKQEISKREDQEHKGRKVRKSGRLR